MSITRNQANGFYQLWELQDFGAEKATEPVPAATTDESEIEAAEQAAQAQKEDEVHPGIAFPTAEQLETLFEQARDEGRDEGYRQGLEEGSAKARNNADELATLIHGFDNAMLAFEEQLAPKVIELACELARQFCHQQLKHTPDTIVTTVKDTLARLPGDEASIYLHPDDARLVKEALGDSLQLQRQRIVNDDSLTRGGCRIDSAGSTIDASVETRWRRIVNNLGQRLRWDEPIGNKPSTRESNDELKNKIKALDSSKIIDQQAGLDHTMPTDNSSITPLSAAAQSGNEPRHKLAGT